MKVEKNICWTTCEDRQPKLSIINVKSIKILNNKFKSVTMQDTSVVSTCQNKCVNMICNNLRSSVEFNKFNSHLSHTI